jgi:hypothetical protein
MGGFEVPQQTVETAIDTGWKVLYWLKEPENWIPSSIAIVLIALLRGRLAENIRALAEVIRAIRGRNGA